MLGFRRFRLSKRTLMGNYCLRGILGKHRRLGNRGIANALKSEICYLMYCDIAYHRKRGTGTGRLALPGDIPTELTGGARRLACLSLGESPHSMREPQLVLPALNGLHVVATYTTVPTQSLF